MPDQLKDDTFANCLKVRNEDNKHSIKIKDAIIINQSCQDDKSTKHWLAQLLNNIETMGTAGAGAGAGQASLKGAQGTKPSQPVA